MELEVLKYVAAGLGAGLAVIGAALGIGKIGQASLEATGRQPAVSGDARTTMIIAAALVEGVTLFALVICLLMTL
jgi:ATP synthase, F0 subunit c